LAGLGIEDQKSLKAYLSYWSKKLIIAKEIVMRQKNMRILEQYWPAYLAWLELENGTNETSPDAPGEKLEATRKGFWFWYADIHEKAVQL